MPKAEKICIEMKYLDKVLMMILSYLFEVLLIECESAETVGMTVLDVWNCFDNDCCIL